VVAKKDVEFEKAVAKKDCDWSYSMWEKYGRTETG
jgi:hypothetical protein